MIQQNKPTEDDSTVETTYRLFHRTNLLHMIQQNKPPTDDSTGQTTYR